MPGSNIWAGLAAFLDSAGQSTQRISRQYEQDVTDDEEKKKKDILFNRSLAKENRLDYAKQTGGAKIQSAMQAILNPMDPQDAVEHLQNADPKVVQQAADTVQKIVSSSPAPLPKQAQRWQDNKTKNDILNAIAAQESTGTDVGAHPRAANGLQAFGKYGIVPELHIDKIGLDPKNPADIAKWKADPELQKQTAERVVDANFKAAGGDVKDTFRRHYGLTSNPDAKQHLADGRSMPSSNEYVDQAMTRYKALGGSDAQQSVEKTAGNARQAIDSLVSQDFEPPSKARVRRDEGTLGKLYATMTPDEIEQNKEYLDRVTQLAGAGREDYHEELAQYGNNLNRQTTAAMNAMKLDEQSQLALMKVKSGVKSLTPEEVRALESRRKLLESMRSQITDFTTRVGSAKSGAREAILKTRPDLAGTEEPGIVGRIFGQKGKPVVDDAKIQKKLDLIDSWMMETDRALAGLGGLERPGADEISNDENTMLSRPGGVSPLSKYLKPVNTK